MKDTFTAPLLFRFFWGGFLSCGQVAGGSCDVSPPPPPPLLVGILHRGPACFSLQWLIRVKSKAGARGVLQIDFPHAEAENEPRRRLHLPVVLRSRSKSHSSLIARSQIKSVHGPLLPYIH